MYHTFTGIRHLDAKLAQEIAEGDRDPITLKPMEDINPSYQPSAKLSFFRQPLTETTRNHINKSVTPEPAGSKKGGLFNFFGTTSSSSLLSSSHTMLLQRLPLRLSVVRQGRPP
jgi:hypothetical protein